MTQVKFVNWQTEVRHFFQGAYKTKHSIFHHTTTLVIWASDKTPYPLASNIKGLLLSIKVTVSFTCLKCASAENQSHQVTGELVTSDTQADRSKQDQKTNRPKTVLYERHGQSELHTGRYATFRDIHTGYESCLKSTCTNSNCLLSSTIYTECREQLYVVSCLAVWLSHYIRAVFFNKPGFWMVIFSNLVFGYVYHVPHMFSKITCLRNE